MDDKLPIGPKVVGGVGDMLILEGHPDGAGGRVIHVCITREAWIRAVGDVHDEAAPLPHPAAMAAIERVAYRKFKAGDLSSNGAIIIGTDDLW